MTTKNPETDIIPVSPETELNCTEKAKDESSMTSDGMSSGNDGRLEGASESKQSSEEENRKSWKQYGR